MTYATTVLADSPTAYWRLGEASGNWDDSSGNGLTLLVIGSPTYGVTGALSGDSDKAVKTFASGSNNYGRRESETLLLMGTGDFTVEAWAKVDTPAAVLPTLIYKGYPGSDAGWALGLDANMRVAAALQDNANPASHYVAGLIGPPISTAAWHHIVALFDRSSGVTVYLDGNYWGFLSTSDWQGSVDDTSQRFTLGLCGYADYPGAYLDEVALYKGSLLSEARIVEHYTVGAGHAPTAPVVPHDSYFIDPAGDDGDTGLVGNPWQTITKVNAAEVFPGDSILFRSSSFWNCTDAEHSLYPPADGWAGEPITYGGYDA
jgi:hypothetical protein